MGDGHPTSRKTAGLATAQKNRVIAAQTSGKVAQPGGEEMTQLHFRDLRRRVDRLEERYLPPRPITVVF